MPCSESVLIVGPSWVGDMVMAQSLLKTLKQKNAHTIIDVLAPNWCHPLLARMPEIRESVLQPLQHGELDLSVRYRLGKGLRSKKYDKAIIIPRSFKAALVPFFARIPKRVGYRGEMRFGLLNDVRHLDKSVLTQTVQRYVALAEAGSVTEAPPTAFPQLTVDTSNQHAVVNKLALKLDAPIVAIVPGAEYGPAKRWPVEFFSQLVSQLTDSGYYVWIFGSQKDYDIGAEISKHKPSNLPDKVINLCGKTSLVDVVDLLALTQAVVCNDSGLMHMAAAVGCEIIAIYGSSTPDYTPPLTDKVKIIYKRLECSPCFKRTCPLGHTRCLTEISVQEISAEVFATISTGRQHD